MEIVLKYFKNLFQQYKFKEICMGIIGFTLFLIIVDYYNCLTFIYNKFNLLIFIICVIFVILKLLSLNILSLFKLKSVCYIDFYTIVICVSMLFYNMILTKFSSVFLINQYKILGVNISIGVCFIVFVIRYIFITVTYKSLRNKKKNINLIDLKELYNNDIVNSNRLIVLKDEDANYDMLGREYIINQIVNIIKYCNYDNKFVISLKGEWGSGKTTILNNVIERIKSDDIIYINEFEPWAYNDEKSVIVSFFDHIMKRINCSFRMNDITLFSKTYIKTIISNFKYDMDDFLNFNIDVERIRKIINNYLELNNKRIVLVLDNLERCSANQILVIIKIIHNWLDLNRIIYILSYDEKTMKNLFENELKLDYSYLEKFVQQEFRVSKIDNRRLSNIIMTCMKNYLNYFNLEINSIELDVIANSTLEIINNLRDFKRIINSAFYLSFQKEQYLNYIDVFFIEIISLKNFELWEEISANSVFYISEDRFVYDKDNRYLYDSQKYNIDTEYYFKNLFENNKFDVYRYANILKYLFPNVEKYFEEKDLGKSIHFIQEREMHNKERYHSSFKNKRVSNGKFFDLYFNKTENEFIKIDNNVKELIEFINQNNNLDEELLEKYLMVQKLHEGWNERYVLENIQVNLKQINKIKLRYLLKTLFYSYNLLNSTLGFFEINARMRAEIVMSDIISKLSDVEFTIFIEEIKYDVKYLYLVNRLIYWQNSQKNKNGNQRYYEILVDTSNLMLQQIKENNINIYDKDNYCMYNLLYLYKDEKYMEFIQKELSINKLMLFIVDCISYSSSSQGFGYIFNYEIIEKLYGWEKMKEDLNKCPDCELKTFLIKAIKSFKFYRIGNEKYTYYTNEWVELNKLVEKFLETNY